MFRSLVVGNDQGHEGSRKVRTNLFLRKKPRPHFYLDLTLLLSVLFVMLSLSN